MRLHRISARHISAAVALSVGGFLGAGVERFRSRAQNDGSEEPINGEESILQYLPLPSVHAKSIPVSDVPAVLPDQSIAVKPQTGVSTVGDVMKYGFPSLDNIRSFDDYVLAYDKRTRTAHWVFEHITKDKISYSEGIDRTKSKFLPDGSIHEYFRGTNEDYKGSGYDRGHLAAAGNHKWSQQALDQTFFLSNISPQVHRVQNIRHKCENNSGQGEIQKLGFTKGCVQDLVRKWHFYCKSHFAIGPAAQ